MVWRCLNSQNPWNKSLPSLKHQIDIGHLVMTNIAMEAMALIEMDDFPSERNLHVYHLWEIFHGYVSHNQMVDITSINQYKLPPLPGFLKLIRSTDDSKSTAVGRRAIFGHKWGKKWWGIIPPASNARWQYSYIFTTLRSWCEGVNFKGWMWDNKVKGWSLFFLSFPAEVAFCSQSQALFSVLYQYWAIADQFFR